MEESKQEHVEKVGELMRWVSEKNKSLAVKHRQSPTPEPIATEKSLSEQQVRLQERIKVYVLSGMFHWT